MRQVTASSFDDEYVLFGLLVVGMAALGVGSLGFIGMGLHVAVQVGHPVAAEYVGGGVEWFVQVRRDPCVPPTPPSPHASS